MSSIHMTRTVELHKTPGIVEKLDTLLQEAENEDGVAPWGEAFLRGMREDHGHQHFLAWDREELVGALAIGGTGTAALATVPSHRRTHVASTLLDTVLGRASSFSFAVVDSATADMGTSDFSVKNSGNDEARAGIEIWAHGALESARSMADKYHARRVRDLWKMSVDAHSQAAVFLAHRDELERKIQDWGWELMTYEESVDRYGQELTDSQWLEVNNEAFAWHPEQGGWDQHQLDSARDTEWFRPEGVFLLWDVNAISDRGVGGGSVEKEEPRCLGFHWTKIEQGVGEVYVVALRDKARGLGLGRLWTAVGVSYVVEQGCEVVELYVEGDNKPAISAYEKLGFELVHRDLSYWVQ